MFKKKQKESADRQTGVDRWREEQHAGTTRTRSKSRAQLRDAEAMRRHISALVVTAVICVCAVVVFWPLQDKIVQGLDIQGGVSVILSASKSDGSQVTSDEMDAATKIVQSRVNALGVSEATVQQQGTNAILVQIPGAQNSEEAVSTIGQTGHLEFVELDEISDADALAKINSGAQGVKLADGSYTSFLDGSYISKVSVEQAGTKAGTYAVHITFNSEGAKIFSDVTSELASTHGRIAIVLDGVVNSAPSVQDAITDGEVSITGGFTLDEAKNLKTVLDSGSLPVSLSYSESRVVGPTLGQDALHAGVKALVIGMVIVAIYLFFFYHGMGILTLLSLALFAALYLGVLATLSHFGMFALTLPGLAGMVLTTASAADSSILVLERFREEIRMGKSIKAASISGSKHGIKTSLDADIVTLVTALALFFVAVGPVKGFGLTLALGVGIDIFVMFLFKAPALRLLARTIMGKNPRFWGIQQDLDEAAHRGGEAHA